MDMRKTKLMVTHPEVTSEKLDDFVSGRGPVRIGLRIAILQGVIDKAPIDQMSRRHNLSRQGIYNLVKRVNEKGIRGVIPYGLQRFSLRGRLLVPVSRKSSATGRDPRIR